MSKESLDFEIQKNLPVPEIVRPVRESKYPFAKMEVNDSFFVPDAKTSTLHACVSRFKKSHNNGMEFTIRQASEGGKTGVRVWRTS